MASKAMRELTDAQLEREWTRKAKEFEKLKTELRDFSAEHQRRAAEARAAQLSESLSDDEKRALMQSMTAEGIKSKEAVNGG